MIICFVTMPGHAISQTGIDRIKFELTHSLRIPDYIVTIEMRKKKDMVFTHVTSDPMKKINEWKHTVVDTSYSIDTSLFFRIAASLQKISKKDIENAGVDGLDGYTCMIAFGNEDSLSYYSVWSPDYATKKRKLSEFLAACKLIIKTAGLKPKKIM